jgi:hypothetical protein
MKFPRFTGPAMAERFPEKLAWHPWFAWHPVVIGNAVVWLETVERRAHRDVLIHKGYFQWEYRNLASGGESA